jgi:hypothetical protein
MINPTEKTVKKFARGYERRRGTPESYIGGADFEGFMTDLVEEFKGIRVGIRKDRGQGLFVSVLAADTREHLYTARVRNTNGRGLDRARVSYSITVENRDVILEFN